MTEIEAILSILDEPVVITSLDFKVSSWSKSATQVYGFQDTEVLGKELTTLLKLKFVKSDQEKEITKMLSKEGFWEGELIATSKFGYPIHVYASVNRYNGSILIIHRPLIDKTEYLISSLIHDIMEPLRSMSYYFDEGEYSKIQEGIDLIYEMSSAILGLFQIPRKMKNEQVLFKDIIDSVLLFLVNPIHESNANIIFECEQKYLTGEKIYLYRLFQNLVENAIKYSTSQPIIKISCKKETKFIHISITDNGEGIPKEMWLKIFQPLKRYSLKKGLGLGLSECKRIVSSLGGYIWVESEVGVGSTFHVILPS